MWIINELSIALSICSIKGSVVHQKPDKSGWRGTNKVGATKKERINITLSSSLLMKTCKIHGSYCRLPQEEDQVQLGQS